MADRFDIKSDPKGSTQDLATGLALAAATEQGENILVWLVDADGNVSTHWLSGSATHAEIAVSGPGLILSVNGVLASVRKVETPIDLCDCTATDPSPPGGCPAVVERIRGTRIEEIDLVTGEATPLLLAPEDLVPSDTQPRDVSFDFEPIASVGSYLFVRYVIDVLPCGRSRPERTFGYRVFDLASQEPVDILTEAEEKALAENERLAAFDILRSDRIARVSKPSDLALVAIEPRYDDRQGILSLHYEFAATATGESSTDNWHNYAGLASIPARTIPAALANPALLAVPPILSAFLPLSPGVRLGGFSPLTGTPAEMEALRAAFGEILGAASEEPAP